MFKLMGKKSKKQSKTVDTKPETPATPSAENNEKAGFFKKSSKHGKSIIGSLKLQGATPSMILDDLSHAAEAKDGFVKKVKGGYRVIVLTDDDLLKAGFSKKNPILGQVGLSLRNNNLLSATTLADRDAGRLVLIPTVTTLNYMDEYDEFRDFKNYRVGIFPENATDEDQDVHVQLTGETLPFDAIKTSDVAPASIVEGMSDDVKPVDPVGGVVEEDHDADESDPTSVPDETGTDDGDLDDIDGIESVMKPNDDDVVSGDTADDDDPLGLDLGDDDEPDEATSEADTDEPEPDIDEPDTDDDQVVPDDEAVEQQTELVANDESSEVVSEDDYRDNIVRLSDQTINGVDVKIDVNNDGINALLSDIKAPKLTPPDSKSDSLLDDAVLTQYRDGNAVLSQMALTQASKLRTLYNNQLGMVVKALLESVSLDSVSNRFGKAKDAISKTYKNRLAEIQDKVIIQSEELDKAYAKDKKAYVELAMKKAEADYDSYHKDDLEANKQQIEVDLENEVNVQRANMMSDLNDDRQEYVNKRLLEMQTSVLNEVSKAKAEMDDRMMATLSEISDTITGYQHSQYQNELKRVSVLGEEQRQKTEADKVRDQYQTQLSDLRKQLAAKDKALDDKDNVWNKKVAQLNSQNDATMEQLRSALRIQTNLVANQAQLLSSIQGSSKVQLPQNLETHDDDAPNL